ncbi:MAG: hypothetical protein V4684_08725 [Pseudomonadota bacterium]
MMPAGPNLNFAQALAPVVVHVDRNTPPPQRGGFKVVNSLVQTLQNASRSAISWGGRPAVYYGTYEFVMSAGQELQRHAGIDPSDPAAVLSLQEIAHNLAAFSQAQYVGTSAALVDAAWNAAKVGINAGTRCVAGVNVFGGPPNNASFLADQSKWVPPGFGLASAGKVTAGQLLPSETPTWEGIYGADPTGNALLTFEYALVVQGAPFAMAPFHNDEMRIPAVPKVGPVNVLDQMWACKHAAGVAETTLMGQFFPMGLVQGNLNLALQTLATDKNPDLARTVLRVGLAAAGTAAVHTTRVGIYAAEKKKADQLVASGEAPAGVVLGAHDMYLHPEGQVLRSFQAFCYALSLLGCLTAVGLVHLDPSKAESQVGDDLAMKLAIASAIAAAGEVARFATVTLMDGCNFAPEGGKAAEEIGDMSVGGAAIGATFAAGPLAGLAAAAIKPLAQLIHAGYDRMMCRSEGPAVPPAGGPAWAGPVAVPMVPIVAVLAPVVSAAGQQSVSSTIPAPQDYDPVSSAMVDPPSREPSTEGKHDTPRSRLQDLQHFELPIDDSSDEELADSFADAQAPSQEHHLRDFTSSSFRSPRPNLRSRPSPLERTNSAGESRIEIDRVDVNRTPTATPTRTSRYMRSPETPLSESAQASSLLPPLSPMSPLPPHRVAPRRQVATSPLSLNTPTSPTSLNQLLPGSPELQRDGKKKDDGR